MIAVPPSVRAVPSSGQITARKGGAVTLECKASGNPVPSIYWTKKVCISDNASSKLHFHGIFYRLQSGSGKSLARIGEGPILTLERVERLQSGVYQCTAENNVGEPVTVDMRLDVLCKLMNGKKFSWNYHVQFCESHQLSIGFVATIFNQHNGSLLQKLGFRDLPVNTINSELSTCKRWSHKNRFCEIICGFVSP